MAEAILDLRLDTVQPNRVRLVYGVQNDYNSRYICARFTANGKPMDIEKTAAVRINAKRPDGKKDAFPGTVNADGTAKVPVAQWMLEVPGEVSASITAVTTGGALTTQEFYIMAKASIWDSTGEPSAENPDKDVLQMIIASENERVAAESTRVANENARKSAETARATAETKRIADEATRVVNEAGRVNAEEIRREEFATWQDEWGKISSFDKRIENLEAAVSPGLVTPTIDDTIAYRKTVPKGVLPNAAVCEVGGMSYRCENLIPFPYAFGSSITTGGVTVKANADGSITLNGTFTASQVINVDLISNYIVLPAGTYRISGIPASGNPAGFVGLICNMNSELETYAFHHTFTITETKKFGLLLQFAVGSSFSNQTLYPMLNKGETVLPYQPYFTGLRDSKVTALESVGANLIDVSKCQNEQSLGTTKIDGDKITWAYPYPSDSDVFAFSYWADVKPNTNYYLSMKSTSIETCHVYTDKLFGNTVAIVTDNGGTFNSGNNKKLLLGFYSYAERRTSESEVVSEIMLNEGTEALPYSPYFKNTLPIPADALDGFGQGVNAQYCNKIVLNPAEGVKKYVKNCEQVILNSTEDWVLNEYATSVGVNVYQIYASRWRERLGVCSHYAFDSQWGSVGTKKYTMWIESDLLLIKTDGVQSLADFKNYLAQQYSAGTPVTIEAVLHTPTETDVSHLFTDDNLLPVEAGGTITAVNEYEQAVPFTIEYTVKGA